MSLIECAVAVVVVLKIIEREEEKLVGERKAVWKNNGVE
jgi:hypothetical protein